MNRKELLKIMPQNKEDALNAKKIVKLGYPLVKPVLRDVLLWLRVTKSDVADIFCDFFQKMTPPPEFLVRLIEKQVGSTNSFLRNRILVDILPNWEQKHIEQIKFKLTTLATHPDCHNNDLECFKLIVDNTLADEKWVLGWLEFRKKQAIERVEMFNKLENKIKSQQG